MLEQLGFHYQENGSRRMEGCRINVRIRLMRKIKILLTKKGMNELHENMNHITKSTIGLLKS